MAATRLVVEKRNPSYYGGACLNTNSLYLDIIYIPATLKSIFLTRICVRIHRIANSIPLRKLHGHLNYTGLKS